MERVIKFRAIIHLDSLDILMPSVAVYPNGQIGFDSEVFEKLLPKHHYIDWDDSCIRHDDEEDEIFENVLSILTGEDWIWLDDSFTLQQFTNLTDKNGKEAYVGCIYKETLLNGEERLYKIFEVEGGFAINTFQDDFYKPSNQIQFWTALSDMQTISWFKSNLEEIGNTY